MIRDWVILVFGCFIFTSTAIQAQTKSGFMPLNRLGVSHQKAWGVDLGLVSHNTVFGHNRVNFFDVSLGAEAIFAKPFVLSPKINFDVGFENRKTGLTLGGGVDLALPTNFSNTTLMITPKVGLGVGSFVRLYYGYNFIQNQSYFPEIGKHRVSLEINIAALHSLSFGI